MGLKEAKAYLRELRKKQGNPYLWPDFLTGLPEKPAILKKVFEVYDRLGKYSILYIRIANIQPYLIKYGPEGHADIIQWAAAVLKSAADECGGFVGAFSTHDFVAVCDAKKAKTFINSASRLFESKAMEFYTDEDIEKGAVLSFMRGGRKIDIGFMRLISTEINRKTDIPKERLIARLGSLCAELEQAL